MAEELSGEFNWESEALSTIEDILSSVTSASLSVSLRGINKIYFNLETLEGFKFTIRLNSAGFKVVGKSEENNSLEEDNGEIYETPYALLQALSPKYIENFAAQLQSRLTELSRNGSTDAALDKDNFLATYFTLPEKAATTIRFFDRGEQRYAVYESDAIFAAQEILGMSSGLRRLQSQNKKKIVEYLNINRQHFDAFVKDLLLVKQYRVEVWVNKGRDVWVSEFKGSPGNLTQFEDLLFTNSEVTVNNGVIGVRIANSDKNKVVGVAHVNMNDNIMNLIEFIDNDAFTNFESVLVQLGPREAVVSFNSNQTDDASTIKTILQRNQVLVNDRKISDFETKDIAQDFSRLLNMSGPELQNIAAHPEMDKKLACSSMAATIKYLDLLSNEVYFNQFALKPFDFGQYVKMDSAACQALHLTQNFLESGSRSTTLISVIDKCRTAQGHRLLAQFLRQPLLSKEKIEERLDLVEIFLKNPILRGCIYDDHLRRVPDCQSIARKLCKKKATLQECYKCYLFLSKLPKLIEALEEYEGRSKKVLQTYFIEPIKSLIEECSKFVEMIETTIDLELAEEGEFMIRPDFDKTLQELRNEMNSIKGRMESNARETRKLLGMEEKGLKLETVSHLGYHFRVTLKDEKLMRAHRDFIILDSKAAGVRFRTDVMERLNVIYNKKLAAYDATQKEFKEDVMDVAAGYYNNFEQLGNILAFLDVMLSFATVSASAAQPFVRPIIHPRGNGVIIFDNLRHPCVEAQFGVNYIPNDVKFDHQNKSFFIVTGPNMGGKSTYLRSIGVATLLGHIGCFIPADHAEISIVDAILARVGAGDCLYKGISTFMAEMIEASFIIKTATHDSLVLIDELGRGTSTYDGFGLCWAISEHLAKETKSFTVLATHFHELTSLSEIVSTVENLHVSAITDEGGITMLYKIVKGPCDRSFGIHVAEVTNFPPEVIENAKKRAIELEDFSVGYSEEEAERRRDSREVGLKLLDEFIHKISELGEKCEDDEELRLKSKVLLDGLKESDNSYVHHLLESGIVDIGTD